MLDLIYQRCFVPLYRNISFPSAMMVQELAALQDLDLQATAFAPQGLGVVLSILFDLVNIFCESTHDAFRKLLYWDPVR